MAKSEDFPGKQQTSASAIRGLPIPEELPSNEPGISISQMLANQKAEARQVRQEVTTEVAASVAPSIDEGRGLHVVSHSEVADIGVIAELAISSIRVSPFQPRIDFNEAAIEDLANSISAVGLVKPITVRPIAEGEYELIGGERRWRAHKILGRETITAYVIVVSDAKAKILALTDNEGQENLSDYESGRSYKRIMESGDEPSIRALARRIGVNHSVVSRCILLLELPESIRLMLDQKSTLIGAKCAKDFVEFAKNDEQLVIKAVESIRDNKWTQEHALRWIAQEIASRAPASKPTRYTEKHFDGVGTVRVIGKKLELRCEKTVNAERMAGLFETFLANLDVESLKG